MRFLLNQARPNKTRSMSLFHRPSYFRSSWIIAATQNYYPLAPGGTATSHNQGLVLAFSHVIKVPTLVNHSLPTCYSVAVSQPKPCPLRVWNKVKTQFSKNQLQSSGAFTHSIIQVSCPEVKGENEIFQKWFPQVDSNH